MAGKPSRAPPPAGSTRAAGRALPADAIEPFLHRSRGSPGRCAQGLGPATPADGGARVKRSNLKYSLLNLHEAHPDWTARKLAAALDCGQAYVRKTARRNGLCLRSGHIDKPIPLSVKSVLLSQMKLLPVPVPGLHDWNQRIAAR